MKNSILLLSLFDVDFESQNLPGRLVHWIEVSNEYWETIFKNSVPQLCRSDHFLLFFHWTTSKLYVQQGVIGCMKFIIF